MKEIQTELKWTEIEQLNNYLESAEEEGWYYGNKEYFDKRHKRLKEFISKLKPIK